MKLKQLTDRIYYLPASAETDRPILGYIKGDKYSVMVDAGNSDKHVELFQQAIAEYGLPTPDYVAITHWHWDHTFGIHAVKGKVIASRLTNHQLEKMKVWEWTEEAMVKRLQAGEDIEFCDRCIRLEYSDRNEIVIRTADIVFDNSLKLDLGGIHCVLENIAGTHSDDSVSIYIPEEKTMFIGDADCEDFYHNNGMYDKTKLNELIRYLEKVNFELYLPGHGEPQSKHEVLNYLNSELNIL
jgi:glyoxylase-like metal-dependent hydrolase (beta-lactamase superfamily II)